MIQLRGLGKGKGFEIVAEYSLLDGDHPELLELISDRVATIYDLLFEGDQVEELTDRINGTLGTSYETLMEASEDAISRLEDFMVEELDEDDPDALASHEVNEEENEEVEPRNDASSLEPLSELDYEILRGEREYEES